MATVEETMLVYVDPSANSNKFYHVVLDDSGFVTTRYGRVGEPGKTNSPQSGGKAKFDSIVRSKNNKGYNPVDIAGSAKTEAKDILGTASRKALVGDAGDPALVRLVDRLVAVNAHEIKAASGGKLNVVDGQVQTPLGLLTLNAISEARTVLREIEKDDFGTARDRANKVAKYMSLVPQNVGRSRNWVDNFLTTQADLDKQSQFLDQLKDSVEFARKQADVNANADEDYSDLFRYRITLVDDPKVIARLTKKFKDTANSAHGYSVNNAKVKNVYALTDSKNEAEFQKVAKELGNVKEMWHGSRAFNVLSIMSKGLLTPNNLSTARVAGAMFGNGLYLSEQSTKSANYSKGGVWSSGRDNQWYMFVADVVMGNEFWPNKWTGGSTYGYSRPDYNGVLSGRVTDSDGKRWNSINVKGGTMGVMNHEAVVPGPQQVALRYLIEFEG